MESKEILDKLLKHLNVRKNTLAKELGYTNGSIFYNIENGRNGISANLAKRISDTYPEINYRWLLTGDGVMLVSEEKQQLNLDTNDFNMIDLIKEIKLLKGHIQGQDSRLEFIEDKLDIMNR